LHQNALVVSDAAEPSWCGSVVWLIAVFPVRIAVNALVGMPSSSDRRLLEEATEGQEAGHTDAEKGQ